MIDLEFLERLIRTLDESGIDHVEIERGGTRIRISKSPSTVSGPAQVSSNSAASVPGPAGPGPSPGSAQPGSGGAGTAAESATASNLQEITSPMVGTFYRASAPDLPPFVDVGARISKGDPLCIIEAMKLMNELEADIEGLVREVCVSNGEPVEYGQVLFRVEPA